MTTNLGYVPNKGVVVITTGADLVFNLQAANTTWPNGTTCVLKFPTQSLSYNATVTPSTATAAFLVQSTATDAIPDGAKFTITLTLPTDPTTEYVWFKGTVKKDK